MGSVMGSDRSLFPKLIKTRFIGTPFRWHGLVVAFFSRVPSFFNHTPIDVLKAYPNMAYAKSVTYKRINKWRLAMFNIQVCFKYFNR